MAVEDVGVDGGAEEADVDDHHRRLLVHAHQQGEPVMRQGGNVRVGCQFSMLEYKAS